MCTFFGVITDERNLPPANRAGDADDIIGSVLVRDGQLVEGTYEPGRAYRVCTRDGITRLPEDLHKILLEGVDVARTVEDTLAEDEEGRL
jgi:hypothetical protein